MSQPSQTADCPAPTVDLSGLDAEQVNLIAKFVEFVRSKEKERAKTDFLHFWESWKARAPRIPEDEAEALVSEAVAFARGHV